MSHRAPAAAFEAQPHRTVLRLALPVFVALSVEPIAATIDTGFVARLGAAEEAALGAAVMVMSSLFWIVSFIAIGTQTFVARAHGALDDAAQGEAAGRGLTMAALMGVVMAAAVALIAKPAVAFMGATGHTATLAERYAIIRGCAAPALLPMLASLGALRGRQDMRAPMWVAGAVAGLNVALDPLFMFTLGWGLGGAAWASALSQLVGALFAFGLVRARFGSSLRFGLRGAGELMGVGRDMMVRTGTLMAFLLLATRAATRRGEDAGASHQMIRQTWMLAAFMLDAFASTAQSLLGYFDGAGRTEQVRRVARITVLWGLGLGALITGAMLLGREGLAAALLPTSVPTELYAMAFTLSAVSMPINALAFVTDGLHMGRGDFRFLRNGMLVSTAVGLAMLFGWAADLTGIWATTAVWVSARAAWGMWGAFRAQGLGSVRVSPGK